MIPYLSSSCEYMLPFFNVHIWMSALYVITCKWFTFLKHNTRIFRWMHSALFVLILLEFSSCLLQEFSFPWNTYVGFFLKEVNLSQTGFTEYKMWTASHLIPCPEKQKLSGSCYSVVDPDIDSVDRSLVKPKFIYVMVRIYSHSALLSIICLKIWITAEIKEDDKCAISSSWFKNR